MEFTWDDGLCPGGRRPRLYLARNGQAVKFAGEHIPGICVVLSSRYNKNGKWSSTTYVLDLPQGVRPLQFLSPLHGVWGEGYRSWAELAGSLGLSVEVAQDLVRGEYPKTAARLDSLEAARS